MSKYKEIHFRLSLITWEELYRIFPDPGERTAFFRKCAQEAVRLGPKSRFVAKLRQRIEED